MKISGTAAIQRISQNWISVALLKSEYPTVVPGTRALDMPIPRSITLNNHSPLAIIRCLPVHKSKEKARELRAFSVSRWERTANRPDFRLRAFTTIPPTQAVATPLMRTHRRAKTKARTPHSSPHSIVDGGRAINSPIKPPAIAPLTSSAKTSALAFSLYCQIAA